MIIDAREVCRTTNKIQDQPHFILPKQDKVRRAVLSYVLSEHAENIVPPISFFALFSCGFGHAAVCKS